MGFLEEKKPISFPFLKKGSTTLFISVRSNILQINTSSLVWINVHHAKAKSFFFFFINEYFSLEIHTFKIHNGHLYGKRSRLKKTKYTKLPWIIVNTRLNDKLIHIKTKFSCICFFFFWFFFESHGPQGCLFKIA